jgi:hypothetical protein
MRLKLEDEVDPIRFRAQQGCRNKSGILRGPAEWFAVATTESRVHERRKSPMLSATGRLL